MFVLGSFFLSIYYVAELIIDVWIREVSEFNINYLVCLLFSVVQAKLLQKHCPNFIKRHEIPQGSTQCSRDLVSRGWLSSL